MNITSKIHLLFLLSTASSLCSTQGTDTSGKCGRKKKQRATNIKLCKMRMKKF